MNSYHSQLLNVIILTLNSLVLLSRLWVFPKAATAEFSTEPIQTRIAFVYWAIRENIASAARSIRRINTSNNDLSGRTILEVYFLDIENVCTMT